MKDIGSIAEAVSKIPLGIFPGLLIANSVLLFVSDSIASTIYVLEFREKYGLYIGISFLLLIAINSWLLFNAVRVKWRSFWSKRYKIKSLHELSPEEKGYLCEFMIENRNTIHCYIGDGIASGLEAKGVIYLASRNFSVLDGPPYNLQPWARKYLASNLMLLEGAVGGPVTQREHTLGKPLSSLM